MSAAATDAIPIYQGRDFYVPTYKVKLRGRELPDDVVRDVVQVSYKDNLEEVDSFEISINNWDAERKSFKYIDEDTFDPGKEIELFMGYHGKDPLRLMIKGEITSLRPNFPATGQPTLAITGLNLLHRLRKKQESYIYEGRTDSQIADQIATRLGLKVCTNRTAAAKEQPVAYLFQDNEYDILFLWERARKLGYDLFVVEKKSEQCDAGQLYFGPSDEVRRTTYALDFNRSLVDFQPELATHKQVGKVTVRGWDAKKKEKIEYTATREDLKTAGLGAEGRQEAVEQSFGDREEVISSLPVNSLD
ncbi:MAG: phage late control D family protein, partial [Acidobacteria bacterium]|nr:phage late control D family protein [Acidobacteriota bacterium]